METLEQAFKSASRLSETIDIKTNAALTTIVTIKPIDSDGETVKGFPTLYLQGNDFFANNSRRSEKGSSEVILVQGDTLGKRLRFLRTYHRLSITIVSERINRSTATIVHWELDKSEPTANDIKKMCSLYRVSPNQLLIF